jgi:hypothetical protein
MNRCQHCKADLAKTDRVCWSCHVRVQSLRLKAPKRFCQVVDLFHVMFVVLTLASVFTTTVPALQICAAGLMVLRLVKRSADYMAEFCPVKAFEALIPRNGADHRTRPAPRDFQSAFEKSRRMA